jgi:O-antigen/teichoic acid export membrane protein
MLKKRLALNFGANLFAQFTTVVVQLASVPLFLRFWSKEHYGVWLLLSAIPSYLSLADAGFATSSANEVSMAIVRNDRTRALQRLHTGWGFLAGISAALLLMTLAVIWMIPWNFWTKFPTSSGIETRLTLSFLCTYSIFGICNGIFEAIYRAAYRNARLTSIISVARLVELAGIGTGVAFTTSMATLAGLMVAIRALAMVFLYVDSRRISPDLHLGLSDFSLDELKRSWRPSLMFMAASLGNALYLQGLTLLVGASLGAAAVVTFNTTRTLTRVIVQFVTMIKHSIWPEFSYLFGAGDLIRARQLNELAFEASGFASLALALLIYCAAPWIIPIWTHHAVSVDPRLLAIFLMSAVLNGLWFVTSGLLMSTNQHSGLTIRYLIAATLTLITAAIAAPRYGIYGVALAMVMCELLLLPYAISRTCRLLHQPVKDLLLGTLQLRATRFSSIFYYDRWRMKTGKISTS